MSEKQQNTKERQKSSRTQKQGQGKKTKKGKNRAQRKQNKAHANHILNQSNVSRNELFRLIQHVAQTPLNAKLGSKQMLQQNIPSYGTFPQSRPNHVRFGAPTNVQQQLVQRKQHRVTAGDTFMTSLIYPGMVQTPYVTDGQILNQRTATVHTSFTPGQQSDQYQIWFVSPSYSTTKSNAYSGIGFTNISAGQSISESAILASQKSFTQIYGQPSQVPGTFERAFIWGTTAELSFEMPQALVSGTVYMGHSSVQSFLGSPTLQDLIKQSTVARSLKMHQRNILKVSVVNKNLVYQNPTTSNESQVSKEQVAWFITHRPAVGLDGTSPVTYTPILRVSSNMIIVPAASAPVTKQLLMSDTGVDRDANVSPSLLNKFGSVLTAAPGGGIWSAIKGIGSKIMGLDSALGNPLMQYGGQQLAKSIPGTGSGITSALSNAMSNLTRSQGLWGLAESFSGLLQPKDDTLDYLDKPTAQWYCGFLRRTHTMLVNFEDPRLVEALASLDLSIIAIKTKVDTFPPDLSVFRKSSLCQLTSQPIPVKIPSEESHSNQQMQFDELTEREQSIIMSKNRMKKK